MMCVLNYGDIMYNKELKKICLDARNSRDSYEGLDEQFLCKEVSIAICLKASEFGLVTCLCSGTFKDSDGQPRDHYWVKHEEIIYDATADQFDQNLEKIHINHECNAFQYDEKDVLVFSKTLHEIIKKMK